MLSEALAAIFIPERLSSFPETLSAGTLERMPRYFFHLHARKRRANPDNTGQLLPDPDAAREMARRIAGRLLAWNLEPVPWLDYQVHVTDEAGAIICQLPLTEVADLSARTDTEVIGSLDRDVTSQTDAEGLLARLDAEISSLVREARPAPRPRVDVQGKGEPSGSVLAPQDSRRRMLWGEQASETQADPSAAARMRSALGDTEAAKTSLWMPFRKALA